MTAMLQFATLTLATLFALAAALVFDWLLLRFAFHLMKPAAVRTTAPRTQLAVGTVRLVRAFSPRS
jgi:hypothetical protein